MPDAQTPAMSFGTEFAARLFTGRTGHGRAPLCYMQLTQQDVATIVAAAHEAGEEHGSFKQRDTAREGHHDQATATVGDALQAAAAAIYFTDNSDYLRALWTVVRTLSPGLAEQLESNPRAAFDEEMNLMETWRGRSSRATHPNTVSPATEGPSNRG